MATAVLIDGSYLLHRSMNHQVFRRFKTKATGIPTGGVFGFLSTIQRLAREFGPSIAVAWEGGGARRKKEVLGDYKANRNFSEQASFKIDGEKILPAELTPDNTFSIQRDIVQIALRYLQIPNVYAEGQEADDVLATMAKKILEADPVAQVIIYTTDQDLYQTIGDRCRVMLHSKGEDKIVDINTLTNTEYVYPQGVIWHKLIRGDVSDNIPGARFFDGKDGTKVLAPRYTKEVIDRRPKTMEELITHLSQFKDRGYVCNSETVQDLKRNLELVQLNYECQLKAVKLNPELTRVLKNLGHVFGALEMKKFAQQTELWSTIATGSKHVNISE